MERTLLLFGVLISLLGIGAAIQCHQCAMIGGDDCGDPYSDDNVDDCGEKDTHCNKYKTIIKIGDSGYINGVQKESVIVTRGCERAEGLGDGCWWMQADGGIIIHCRCSSDECNVAPGTAVAGKTLLTVGVLTSLVAVWVRS